MIYTVVIPMASVVAIIYKNMIAIDNAVIVHVALDETFLLPAFNWDGTAAVEFRA